MTKMTKTAWAKKNNCLEKRFDFSSFTEAMMFMVRVSYECERMDHHPSWRNVYNQIWVSLSTHSAGDKVTHKDRTLAKMMDKLYKKYLG